MKVLFFEDLEKKYAEEYLEIEYEKKRETTEARLKWNMEKLELLEQKLNTIIESKT